METMKLLGFRVTKFRSVKDSGWISTEDVTALIGINESGKTNLLIPLWKLKPANNEPIQPMPDYPRTSYGEIRAMEHKPVFIEASFELSEDLINKIAEISNISVNQLKVVTVKRDLGGNYYVSFPDVYIERHISKKDFSDLLMSTLSDIQNLSPLKSEEDLKNSMILVLENVCQKIEQDNVDNFDIIALKKVLEEFNDISLDSPARRSLLAPRFLRIKDELEDTIEKLEIISPGEIEEVEDLIIQNMPFFVYYSNYGNLDSEIYLPHVIDNMRRSDLGNKEEAKVRTLKVLFDFVKLQPEEILELGKEAVRINGVGPTEAEIKKTAENTKEREILLQSASTSLTNKFRSWWKQGEYRFRFQADGNHFRIWVSDDKRAEEIELEGRSTGLQWFLSFYLTFLVESANAHKGAILLLDEPGLSLHALAQRDLSAFFESLSQDNQILYTTHSPFLVDADHLDRVKAVYIDNEGATVVSDNLRASEGDNAQYRSIYPVHAALGLSVSLTLMQGCQPVIVEGQSDQIYLSLIKNYLLSQGFMMPKKELLFIPSGGVKGIMAIVSVLVGKDEELPFVVVDSDRSGLDIANKLKSGLYQESSKRIVPVGDIVKIANAEIEDLFPVSFLADVITRFLHTLSHNEEDDFSDVIEVNKPIINQAEMYAKKYNIKLDLGWKVEVAKRTKSLFLKKKNLATEFGEAIEMWKSLFIVITSSNVESMEAEKKHSVQVSD